MDRLDAMAVFAAVCDASGFAPAARKLGLSPSVVTRQVAGLEAMLGVRLLQRTTRTLSLTEAGARYLDQVRRILAGVAEAEEAARGDAVAPRGRLVVTAPVIFGRMHVAPLLQKFMLQHPAIAAELLLGDRNAHLVEEGIDMAIRIGTLEDSSLVARTLGRTRRVMVGSPAYLTRRGKPRHPAELVTHELLMSSPLHASREWLFRETDGKPLHTEVQPRLETNSGDAAIAFARSGHGLTQALLYQVMPYIAAGELSVVLEAFEPPPAPIQAVHPSGRMAPAKLRAFLGCLQRESRWEFMTWHPTTPHPPASP